MQSDGNSGTQEQINSNKMKTQNKYINVPEAAEEATGCIGANSYRDYAKKLGYKFIEVLNWCSSAGDWQFIISKDGKLWQILDQTNNYPRIGFAHSVDETIYRGTSDEVLEEIVSRFS